MEVYIEKKNWDKIINYARCASDKWGTEIGGMAVTIQDKDDDWEIKAPVIMKQEVGGGSCDLDKTELAEYYSKMAMKYKNKNMRFCWWHSHAKMNAFWSGTDTSTIDEYKDGDLSFALVVNVKGDYKCRVSLCKPFVVHQDVELNIINDISGYKIPRKIETEVVEACTQLVAHNGYFRNGNQIGLWNRVYNEDEIDKKRDLVGKAWAELLEFVDALNTSFISGEIQYDKYSESIQDLNKKLKKKDIPLTVLLVSQNSFDDLLTLHAFELIECDPGYEDLDPSEAYNWNESFRGGLYG